MATHRQAPAAKPVAAAAPRAVPGTPKKRTAGGGGRVPPPGPQHAPNKALALPASVRLPKLIRARLSASLVRTAGRPRGDEGRPQGRTWSRAAWRGWRGGGGRAARFPWAAGAPAPAGSAPTPPRRRPKLVLWLLLCGWVGAQRRGRAGNVSRHVYSLCVPVSCLARRAASGGIFTGLPV